ncbi:MAG: signal peptidase II [bacterium]
MGFHRMRPGVVAIAVVLLDQATKWLVRQTFSCEGARIEVIPGFFNFCYIRNPGAAWGMLAGCQLFLIIFSLAAMVLLVWRRQALLGDLPWRWLVLGLLLGGICGNLIDRVCFGYVVDFLDFYYRTWSFPAFNVADSSICIGVGLFILLQWLAERRKAS